MKTVNRREAARRGYIMHGASTDAADVVRGQGLSLPDKPEGGLPELPEDLTAIGDEELMELFAQLTSYAGFLATQHAIAQIDERASEREVELAEAKALISGWGGKGDRVAVAKATRAIDDDVIEMHQELEGRHAYRKLIEVLYGNVDRSSALVSREVTRRTSGPDPKTRRTERYRP